MQHVERVTHFSSRAGRSLPFGEYAKTAVLDAWTPLGPGNIGGRTRVVRYHPAQPHILYAAGVSGGIWKSDDNGITWRPLATGLANLAVNSFAIDPGTPDVMFVGTGEGYFREEIRGTGLPLRGGGIFMTEDGSTSWRRVPGTDTSDFYWVNDLELGVSDSRVLFAATRTGVWRSTDWGQSWVALLGTHVRGGCLPGAPDRVAAGTTKGDVLSTRQALAADSLTNWPASRPRDGWVTSVAFDPQNPDTVYATYGSFGGSHVYRSRDGGGTGRQSTAAATPCCRTSRFTVLRSIRTTAADCISAATSASWSPWTADNDGWSKRPGTARW